IHYHLLVVMDQDIRTGFDFEAVKAKDYRSAGEYLRAQWEFWRQTAPKYGFGRHELLPIRKTGEALAKYVGKYIGKHIEHRLPEDKGARLVRYSRGTNRARAQFSWCTPGAALWRTKLGLLCRALGLTSDNYTEQLREWYGPRWCHTLAPMVDSIKPLVYPSFWTLQKDFLKLEPPPKELWDDPDCNPNTGGWMNPDPDQARQSLLTAWIAALDERQRRWHRHQRRESPNRRCPLTEVARSAFPRPGVPWIKQTARDD
ncbi:MAG: hypothetical protein KGS61_10435, partial [Verrucomicrobia bacterium]|nr:hypothetical protein [Verrucomicrobiota bacterium]